MLVMTSWALTLRTLRAHANWRGEHARNFLSFIVSRVGAISLFALSVPYLVRGPSVIHYGVIALLFAIFSYISMVDLGIGYAVNLRCARALARGRSDAGQIVSTAILLFLILGIVLSLVVFAVRGYISSALLGARLDSSAIAVLGATAVFVLVSSVFTSLETYEWFLQHRAELRT